MNANYRIEYLSHQNIDKIKWDACIGVAAHSLIYNYSWYLDAMAPQWDALVLNDYEAVMPLVWKTKFGICYLYQPFLTAQLGITGANNNAAITDAFLQALPAHFKFTDIDLHENNTTVKFESACSKRTNMLLDISKQYADVQKGYHRLANRMIRKAAEENWNIEENANITESIEFYRQQYNPALKIPAADYEKAILALNKGSLKGHVLSLAIKKNGKLAGIYILLQDNHYLYSVIGGSTRETKDKGAFYMLTDHAIKIASGKDKMFRFEGSDIPGIAAFNQQFGAIPFTYNHLKINRLPFFIKWLKN